MSSVVLAISGSLRNPSFTEKMLDLCLEGMRETGKELEVHKFYPHKMNIGPCNSCWSCWSKKNPGVCAQKDDFDHILDVFKRADYFLLAAPLYIFDFPATVKNVLDRFFILLEPTQIELPSGGSQHPKRFGRQPKSVLISSCGFPEIENFTLLSQHFRIISEHMEWKWSGELLISAAGAAHAPKMFDHKYKLIKKAGAELIKENISAATSKAIAASVMPAEDYRRMATLSFEGGLTSKMKMAAIAIKAINKQNNQEF
ncbi:MAG: flavodoxin family protein [Chlorobiaceae bacterium]